MSDPVTTTRLDYAGVVDLDAYPIHDLDDDGGLALVGECRRQLAATGGCTLPGFIRPEAVAAMVALAGSLAYKAWNSDQTHTVYFEPVDETVRRPSIRVRAPCARPSTGSPTTTSRPMLRCGGCTSPTT